MLYDKSLEKDNCGFGLIAHIEGEPSHKVVRTAIHALARMQHRGAILADGKTGDGCGLLLQKPDRFFRIVAEERGWRLAKNYAVGMIFLNKDPELAAASRHIVEEELQQEPCRLSAGAMCQPMKACSVKSPSPPCRVLSRFLSTLRRAGVRVIWSAVCLSPADALKNACRTTKISTYAACRTRVNIYKGLCMPADLPRFYRILRICVWNRPSACSTSAFPLTPCRVGRWRSRSATRRITARLTLSPATASGRAPYL